MSPFVGICHPTQKCIHCLDNSVGCVHSLSVVQRSQQTIFGRRGEGIWTCCGDNSGRHFVRAILRICPGFFLANTRKMQFSSNFRWCFVLILESVVSFIDFRSVAGPEFRSPHIPFDFRSFSIVLKPLIFGPKRPTVWGRSPNKGPDLGHGAPLACRPTVHGAGVAGPSPNQSWGKENSSVAPPPTKQTRS